MIGVGVGGGGAGVTHSWWFVIYIAKMSTVIQSGQGRVKYFLVRKRVLPPKRSGCFKPKMTENSVKSLSLFQKSCQSSNFRNVRLNSKTLELKYTAFKTTEHRELSGYPEAPEAAIRISIKLPAVE